ncbi:PAQR family membrane homeostasis protein TrhA [Wenxinia marina]|nr:hemolysin III family protein [Wenxinia marina]GGL70365.1 Hly-III family protein [Wenxinia marina]
MTDPLPDAPYDYPAYARSERIADFVVHTLGMALGLIGTTLLIVFAAMHLGAGHVAVIAIYGAALTFSFVASTLYHFTPWEGARPLFRRLDHAGIFLKIAGTYTPFALIVGTVFGYAVLAVVWVLALVGVIRKLFFWTPGRAVGVALYLALGWLSVALIWPLAQVAPLATVILIAVGGILYTSGVVFFLWEKLKYCQAIWHGFVLTASSCFFTAIALGLFLTA